MNELIKDKSSELPANETNILQKLKQYKLYNRPNMNFVKKVKTFIVDPHTIYEGEVDQLGKPSGCGCRIKFYQTIRGIKRKGTVIKVFKDLRIEMCLNLD